MSQFPNANINVTFSDATTGRNIPDSIPDGWTLGKYAQEKGLRNTSSLRVRKANGDVVSDLNTVIVAGDTILNTPAKLSGSNA